MVEEVGGASSQLLIVDIILQNLEKVRLSITESGLARDPLRQHVADERETLDWNLSDRRQRTFFHSIDSIAVGRPAQPHRCPSSSTLSFPSPQQLPITTQS